MPMPIVETSKQLTGYENEVYTGQRGLDAFEGFAALSLFTSEAEHVFTEPEANAVSFNLATVLEEIMRQGTKLSRYSQEQGGISVKFGESVTFGFDPVTNCDRYQATWLGQKSGSEAEYRRLKITDAVTGAFLFCIDLRATKDLYSKRETAYSFFNETGEVKTQSAETSLTTKEAAILQAYLGRLLQRARELPSSNQPQ